MSPTTTPLTVTNPLTADMREASAEFIGLLGKMQIAAREIAQIVQLRGDDITKDELAVFAGEYEVLSEHLLAASFSILAIRQTLDAPEPEPARKPSPTQYDVGAYHQAFGLEGVRTYTGTFIGAQRLANRVARHGGHGWRPYVRPVSAPAITDDEAIAMGIVHTAHP